MKQRIVRIQRLVAVEAKRVAKAEQDLGGARQKLSLCQAALTSSEVALTDAYARWLDVVSVDELAQASAHRSALQARVAAQSVAMANADAEVRVLERAVVAARTAERRLEILIEGFEAADATRASKAERRLADEHASRATGRARGT